MASPVWCGCIEHGTILGEILKDMKSSQKALTLIWLDLKNTYGSVKHVLGKFALWWYHVPQEMAELLFRSMPVTRPSRTTIVKLRWWLRLTPPSG